MARISAACSKSEMAAASHYVPEKKEVSGGMAKTALQSMSLKLKGLDDSAVARATKKNPPKISERSLKVIENTGSRGCRFSGPPLC